jgi:hypothetical protein
LSTTRDSGIVDRHPNGVGARVVLEAGQNGVRLGLRRRVAVRGAEAAEHQGVVDEVVTLIAQLTPRKLLVAAADPADTTTPAPRSTATNVAVTEIVCSSFLFLP